MNIQFIQDYLSGRLSGDDRDFDIPIGDWNERTLTLQIGDWEGGTLALPIGHWERGTLTRGTITQSFNQISKQC